MLLGILGLDQLDRGAGDAARAAGDRFRLDGGVAVGAVIYDDDACHGVSCVGGLRRIY